MKVFYRITSIPSTNPSPVFQHDKNKLNELCLKSFNNAFEGEEIEVTFLADNLEDFDLDMCEFPYEVLESSVGINETMLKSYELAAKEEGIVLFQECDYFYRPGIGKQYIKALHYLDVVSPYDHLNFYSGSVLHSEDVKLRLVGRTHYRTTERNTMTWGCNSALIRKHRDIFDKYGYLDGDVWYDLKDEGELLWVPIPSFATHMVEDYLAPSINWEELWLSIL